MIFGRKRPRFAYSGTRRRSTSISIKRWLLGVVFVLVLSPLLGAVYTYTRAGEGARVHAAAASTLNFQARLHNASGSLVPDGSYSIQFKLYDAVTAGTNEWTETQSVTVKNGYLSANLGSVTGFSPTIDWSQEKWLTMNVNSDGEMTPRIKLTAVPYAFRAGQADTLTITGGSVTGDNLLQKAPGSVQSLSSANAGLRFNQTGAGGLIQLQGNGLDIFTVSKAGDVSTAGNLAILGGAGTFGSSSQAGSIVLNDGTTNTGTLSTASLTANRTYTLPDVSGTICLTSTCGPGAGFVQNGNAFTADGVLGTTDNYALRFITNNTEKFTILATGNVGVGDTTPAALFTVGTSDALQINASGNLVTSGSVTANNGASVSNGLTLNSSAISGVTTLSASGAITAATTVNTINGLIINSGSLSGITGFSQTSGTHSVTGTGAITLGGGSNALTIDSTNFDVSSTGALSGITTISLSGAITGATTVNTINGLIINSGALSGISTLNMSGAITAATTTNTINGLIINSGALSGVTGITFTSGNLVLNSGSISGVTTYSGSGNINTTGGALQTNSVTRVDNSGNLTNIGTITAGSGTLNLSANGNLTSTFTVLDGSTTATSASGLTPGTVNVVSTTNFDVGNYILVNGTYAKITGKTGTSLSITPSLSWANGAAVTEYNIPEIGGTNTGSTLANRYGRGYFIAGVATGNGTTYYNENSIETSLTSYDLLNTSVTTLNFAGAATTLNIGNSGTTVNILGSLATGASETITAGGGLVVSSGGINNNNGGITNTGALTGVTTISASGAITAATATNTINGLIINSGALSGVTGITFTSGGINLNAGGITNTGSLAGVTTISASGAITAATTVNTINGLIINSGALSGISTLNMSGAITAATSTNTINGLIINSGALSGVTTLNASGLGTFTGGIQVGGVTDYMTISSGGDFSLVAGADYLVGANKYAFRYIGAPNYGLRMNSTLGRYEFTTSDTTPVFYVDANTGDLIADGALTVHGIDNSSSGITNTGSLTGVGANITGTGALTVASGGAGNLLLNAASGLVSIGATTLQTANSLSFDLANVSNTTLTLQNSGTGVASLNISDGELQVGGLSVISSSRVLQNVTADTGILTSGTLGTVRGGTGLNTFTSNGVLYASSTSALTQALGTSGQILMANASGVPTFTALSGDVTVSSTGVATIGANTVILGTDTTGNYVATISVGNGLAVSGVGAENATASLSITLPTTGTTATTSSNSGLELTASGLSLFRGCTNGQVMEWNGTAWNCATDNTGFSDSRLKTNVSNVGSVLDTLKDVRVVTYNYDCLNGALSSLRLDCDNHTGIIAQEVATLFPSAVHLNGGGYYEVDFNVLNFMALKGVVELANKINAAGDASLNNISTGGSLRLTSSGALQNITGLNVISGGATIVGGLNASGGTISLNDGGVLANTNINTGLNAGTVTIGGGNTSLTINSIGLDLTSAGALSGISGYSQGSGNFAISGLGTFSTGTGAISLNGAVTAGSNLTVTGLSTFNGNVTIGTGDILTFNGEAFTDLTGNGLSRSVTSTLTIDATTAGTVVGTGSNSGLVVAADGVSLIRGCSNNQILKWSTTGPQWNCAADNSGLSDSRLKKNIVSVDMSVLSRIRDINLYSFDYDCTNPAFQTMHCDTEHQEAGVIAQELIQQFPELVMDVNGHYEVNYDALGLYNMKAVGELADQVDALSSTTQHNEIVTNSVLRMTSNGALQNITGLTMNSGGASIVGGLNNNGGGITSVGALTGVTSIGAQSISLAAAADGNLLTLTKDGQGVFTVFNSGALQLQLDSAQALAVKSANGDNVLNVDTLTGRIKIGSGNNGKTVLFVLDSKSTDGDPAGVNGAQYYNSKMNKFRCYQNDKWQDCLQTAFSEYSLVTQHLLWPQPSGDTELPGENRTWIDLGNANQIRTLANVTVAGASGASCRLQYSLTEVNPTWHELTSGSLAIDHTGALKTDWLPIDVDAKKEVLVRVMCNGGNGVTTPDFTNIRAQVR